ncbi:MAG: asparagine synthase B [Candidatus Glassbacteria bacterium]|nr:asparagine synthase B [Candidatus Glassbacteria bacterium]
MCGIAGIWGEADDPLVREMMGRLAHRGPDAEGMLHQEQGTLGHRRLSIMDPANGDQPIFNEQGTRAILANGEIYNFPSLREDLARRYRFRTRSDSEAALHLYDQEGAEAVQKLDGMFALAIADEQGVFLARDPIGIKPLYYGRRNGALVFSSELKALEGRAREISEFPPGSWYHSASGMRRYYELPRPAPPEMSTNELVTALRAKLEEAVVKRLMSDVPVGAFLSGGLDSSLIAAIARRHMPHLHTFSVGVKGSRDLEAARLVARHLDTIHHEYFLTTEEVRALLPEIVYHLESFDQDLVPSAVPCYFVSRMAAAYVKVVLTGEGADELFAGYTYYQDIADRATLHRELRRSVGALHNMNLQRVDRLTMAHSLEGRVPFLDVAFVEMGLAVPPELKLMERPGGGWVEKWILRKAGEGLLPEEILWRNKEQFDEGSGATELLNEAVGHWLSPEAAARYAEQWPGGNLRSQAECVFHKLLCEAFTRPSDVLGNVARWALERDPAVAAEPGEVQGA